jgi:hypothetical protein
LSDFIIILRLEVEGYLRATGLRPGFDFTIETADEFDPLKEVGADTNLAKHKQLNYLAYLIKNLAAQAQNIIPDPELDDHAQLVLQVYDRETSAGPLTVSRASSFISTIKDLMEEIECLPCISPVPSPTVTA